MLYMMYQSALKELRLLLRDKVSLAFLFVLPGVFIFVMTMALQGAFSEGSDEKVGVLFASADSGPLTDRISKGLETLGWIRLERRDHLGRDGIHGAVLNGEYAVAVYVPAGASERLGRGVEGGPRPKVEIVRDPTVPPQVIEAVKGTVASSAQTAAATIAAPAMARMFAPSAPESALRKSAEIIEKRILSSAGLVEVEEASPEGMATRKKPNSAEQNVPAYTVLGIYFIAIVLAGGIAQERKLGTYRRILVSAAPGHVVVTAKIIPFFFVNLLQAAIMFSMGTFLIPLAGGPSFSPGGSPAGLAAVTACASLSALGFGVLVSSMGLNYDGTAIFTAVTLVIMAALAGVMVPSFIMPGAMIAAGRITPQNWALEAYLDLIVRGKGMADVLPHCAALLGFAVFFYAAGVLFLKRGRI